MKFWTAWYADFPLTEEGRILLFESAGDAVNYAKADWPAEYVFAQECVIHEPAA